MNNSPERIMMLIAAGSVLLGVIGACMIMGDEIRDGNDMIKTAL